MKISVVVPVYNVKNDLEKCVDSIRRQTFSDIEIILVDDGSTDESGAMCDRFALEDDRIRVIHKENGGLSSARNAGIDVAQGEYIAFVDSDDWIDSGMLQTLLRACEQTGAPMSECSFRNVYADHYAEETRCDGSRTVVTAAEAIESNLDWRTLKPVAWNKLYRRDVIGDIRYPNGRVHEDEFTTHRYYLAAGKIAYVDVSLYNYNKQRDGSITAAFKVKNLDKCDAMLEKLRLVWSTPSLSVLEGKMASIYCYVLFTSLSACVKNRIRHERVDEVIRQALEVYPELRRHGLSRRYQLCFEALRRLPLKSCTGIWKKLMGG